MIYTKNEKDGLIYETKITCCTDDGGRYGAWSLRLQQYNTRYFGSDSTPVSITTTESWDFSTGFYPAMSPATSNGTYGFTYYARNCYDTLVVRENGEFKAGLAKRGTSAMMDCLPFHLKEGVKFSDGADLNAEAVKPA